MSFSSFPLNSANGSERNLCSMHSGPRTLSAHFGNAKAHPKAQSKERFFMCVSAMTSPRPDDFRSRTGTHDLDSGMKVRLFLALSTIFALIGAICDRRTHFVTLIKSSPGGNRKKEYEKRERGRDLMFTSRQFRTNANSGTSSDEDGEMFTLVTFVCCVSSTISRRGLHGCFYGEFATEASRLSDW